MKSVILTALCGCVLLVDGPAAGDDVADIDCGNAATQADMNICAQRDYETADAALNTQYALTRKAMADLDAGRIDAATLTTAEGSYRAKQSGGLKSVAVEPDDRVAASAAPGEVVLVLNKEATALAEAFSADIEEMLTSGEIAKILSKNDIDPSLAGPGS